MTKKDYELIAESLRESTTDIHDFGLMATKDEINEISTHICDNLASALASENPKFDTTRFLNACGVKL